MHNLRTSQPQDLMAHLPLNEEMAQRLKSLGKPLDKAGEVREIQTSVEGFVQNLLTVVGLLDSRFICTMIPSGSFYEETKIGSPDEFDFMAEIKVLSFPHASGVVWHSAFPGKPIVGVHPFLSKYVFYDLVGGPVKARNSHLNHYNSLSASQFKKKFWQLIDQALDRILQYPWPQFGRSIELKKCADCGPAMNLVLTWKGERTKAFRDLKISVDIAPTIKFHFWPESTDHSSANFPSQLLHKVQMKNLMFHVVPLCPFWRASFSLVEMDIMRGFQPTSNRIATYRLAKFFRDRGGFSDQYSIPSYILKTAFFFELEWFQDDKFWTDDSLYNRVYSMFNRLKRECVRDDGVVGNFFISAAAVVTGSREDFVLPAIKRITSDLTLMVVTGHLVDREERFY